ncbi:TRAP transporter substrate-binding protein [Lutispora thermophila]|uniref:Tripartite ATP-independent transporter solute receptor, DctP family n=1 Tax=Lutispora thermophila DSM 19022 TaxID=1122184 RepID=A0A1M6C9G1_9FIRM|nr:TRAP transporter substrate-binding protein [Lutispora thermophila]SHI57649.1 tripartite ATP-independent transporter solute receptor, DctP family [Lutispora thermophila DSM 19022]
MKKLLIMLMVLVMALVPVACSSKTPSTQPTEQSGGQSSEGASGYDALKPVVLIGADNASMGAAAQLFGELVSKKVSEITGGKLTVEYYPNSQLGNDQELQSQMLAGDIDFVVCQTAQTVNFVPEVAIFDLPLVFAKYDAKTIDYALNKSPFFDKINEAYTAKNMRVMHYLQAATFRETTSNKKISTIDDFKNLKIRTMENQNHMAFWKALGAAPTPLPWSEVYVSLQQGLVDAQENATDTSAGANLQEVQKYLVLTHHILYCNQFLINNSKYESLDPLYQAALQQAVNEAAVEIEAKLATIDTENRQKLANGGIEVIELDNAFIDQMLEKAQGVYDSIGKAIGQEYVDTLQNALQNPQ